MISFPPCKINLGLNVVSKRSDGYHNIETCFYPVPWTDVLEIIIADRFSFTASGNSIPGDANTNLCIKAYNLLKQAFNLAPVAIHLHKVIPTGAGLGGGSSDGAHALRILNRLFNLDLSNEKLKAYALRLGSDCPFFIEDKPMLGTGRGEVLTNLSVNLSGKFLVLVKPDVHVSTADAYSGVRPMPSSQGVKDIIEQKTIVEWKDFLKNDFEESVFNKYPLIKGIKEKLYQHGAVYASMSGSGSAVVGIFEKPVDLKTRFPGAIYWSKLL